MIAKRESGIWGKQRNTFEKYLITPTGTLPLPFSCLISYSQNRVWNVKFNPSHDQLLLTSGSDCQVNLESVVSTSSVPFYNQKSIPLLDEEPECKTQDGLVETFEQHEDSVYAVQWSAADPWLFASLSYDGRLLVNFVPKDQKYKIIL